MSADTEVAPPSPGEVRPEPPRTETERLDPQPTPLTLENGMAIEIEPLKLRQFLRFLRILTRGGATMMSTGVVDLNPESPQFTQGLMAMVLFAVPESEDETIQFIQSMVRPAGLTGRTDKAGLAADQEKINDLSDYLMNPELEDLLTILQKIVEREGSDLQALGKRLRGMFQTAQKMGAVPAQVVTSSADSASPSTT